MGHAPDSEEAGASRRARYGAHLGRTHERHELWHVPEEELNRRRAAWQQPAPRYVRGYGAMFSAHIGQADEGCDFDFLAGAGQIPEPEIH